MTVREIYDLALRGGGNDFQAVVELLERIGEPWCLIGGLAVNAYCEPVYTADADFVVIASPLEFICAELAGLGFAISRQRFWINARLQGSDLVMQFTTDPRYQDFLGRAAPAEVLGAQCRVASLADLFQGKLWAAADPLSLWCWRRLGRPDCFSFRRLIRQWRLIRLIRRRRGSRPGQL